MTVIFPLQRVVGRTVAPYASKATSFTATTTTTTTAVAAVCRLSPQIQPLCGIPRQDSEQRRSFWMDVVTRKPQRQGKQRQNQNNNSSSDNNSSNDKSSSNFVHEDPEQIVRRHTDETRSDGEALLDLMFFNDRHEKAWRKRQRLQRIKRYEFDKKHVNDLAKYIAFVKDNKE